MKFLSSCTIEAWLVLYGMSILVIYFIYSSIYVSILIFQFLPPPLTLVHVEMKCLVSPLNAIGSKEWHPTPVLLPRNFHGWRSLMSYSPRGHKDLDMTERLHFTSLDLKHQSKFQKFRQLQSWKSPTPTPSLCTIFFIFSSTPTCFSLEGDFEV